MISAARTAAQTILFAFREAALAHARAPGNDTLQDLVAQAGGRDWRGAIDELVGSGQIKIEICGKNWRIVTLLKEGIATAAEPNGRSPYLVIDQNGRRRF